MDLSIIIPAHKPDRFLDRLFHRLNDVARHLKSYCIQAEVLFIHSEASEDLGRRLSDLSALSLRYFSYQNILSPSEARNVGFNASIGRYVFFHDVDDLLNFDSPTAFRALSLWEFESKYDVICFRYRKIRNGVPEYIDHGIKKFDRVFPPSELMQYIELYSYKPHFYTLFVHCWSKIYRREFLVQNRISFNIKLTQLEDVNFNINVILSEPIIYLSSIFLYDYNIQNAGSNLSSLSGSGGGRDIQAVVRALHPIRPLLFKLGSDHQRVRFITRSLYSSIIVLWLLRFARRQRSFHAIRRVVGEYLRSEIVRQVIPYYIFAPGTSVSIPLLIRIRSRFLLSVFLRFRV